MLCGIVASGLAMAPPELVACSHNSSWLTEHRLGAASVPRSSGPRSTLLHSNSSSCRVTLVRQLDAGAAGVGSRTSSDSGFYR